MNLVIDIGNTFTKVAVFHREKILYVDTYDVCSVKKISVVAAKYPQIENVILSSVVNHDKKIILFLKKKYNFIELTHLTNLPVKNKYSTKSTLGKDRLACAVASNTIFRNKNVLSVDAGTCIKYDLVTSKNEYIGGAISPGIDMRFKALQHFTNKLPLVSYKYFSSPIGNSTHESILSGVVTATAEEVKGMIELYRARYSHLQVILTGGNIRFLQAIFNTLGNKKSSIFADPYLLLRGLNYILNHNTN